MSEPPDVLIARLASIMREGVQPRLLRKGGAISEGAIIILVTEGQRVVTTHTPNMDQDLVVSLLGDVRDQYERKS